MIRRIGVGLVGNLCGAFREDLDRARQGPELKIKFIVMGRRLRLALGAVAGNSLGIELVSLVS